MKRFDENNNEKSGGKVMCYVHIPEYEANLLN